MKSNQPIPILAAALLLLAFGLPSLSGAPVVVFSNYGPGDSFNTGVGWGISGSAIQPHGYRAQAQRFTPDLTANLSSIQLSLFRASGSGRSNFSLVEDADGYPTGQLLETFPNVLASARTLLTSATQPLLEAGVTYWLRAEPYDATTSSGWYYNNQGAATTFGFSFSPGVWQIMPPPAPADGVFRVSAVPVPEPGIGGLLALALGLCTWRFRLIPLDPPRR